MPRAHLLPAALALTLIGLAGPATAKPGVPGPGPAKPTNNNIPKPGTTVSVVDITLDVSPSMGDLGPHWHKALGFNDHTASFDFRWKTNGPSASGTRYRVYDDNGNVLTTKTLSSGTQGMFSIALSGLPKRSKYVIRVQQIHNGTPVGAASNAVTLSEAEPVTIPFGFAPFIVEDIRAKWGVPGLSVAVSCGPGDVKEWVAGTRRKGNTVLVQPDDPWHIGSNTKAFTTTMIAKLVEEGLLDWDTTVWELAHGPANLFPELKGGVLGLGMDQHFKKVTIEHLASHRSGMKMKPGEDSSTRQLLDYDEDPKDFRAETMFKLLRRPHVGKVGEWRYGHGNYMLLGVIIERLRGKPYEQVIAEEILAPAGLNTAAFGMPTDTALNVNSINPWATHLLAAFTVQTTKAPNGHLGLNGTTTDNIALPPVWDPAGGLYMSSGDVLRFLRLHIDGKVGSLTLSKASRNKLHSIYTKPDRKAGPWDIKKEDQRNPNYGWGFGQGTDPKLGKILTHDGSYFRFYSTMIAYVDRGIAVTATANLEGGDYAGDNAAVEARNWAVVQALQHCKPKPTLKFTGSKAVSSKLRKALRRQKNAQRAATIDVGTDFDLHTAGVHKAAKPLSKAQRNTLKGKIKKNKIKKNKIKKGKIEKGKVKKGKTTRGG